MKIIFSSDELALQEGTAQKDLVETDLRSCRIARITPITFRPADLKEIPSEGSEFTSIKVISLQPKQ